jgi:hypothetical protein
MPETNANELTRPGTFIFTMMNPCKILPTRTTGGSMANQPTHVAYAVRNFEKQGEPDSSWSRMGAGFRHKGGKGFDVVPVSGRIVLRLNEPRPKKGD